jgi:CRISPR system Cascade subunit CasC
MLQSVPPGNLNRDESGQPKKCVFGRVTRARISSQCLKRNIRRYFKDVFGDAVAVRTTYLPRMVADELRKIEPDMPEDDLNKIKAALAKKFKADNRAEPEDTEEGSENQGETQTATPPNDDIDRTGQLVFFPPPLAKDVAKLIATLMQDKGDVYREWVNGTRKEAKKLTKQEKNKLKKDIEKFEHDVTELSKSLTVDIRMFGRMTTSDLVVNVEAACQVAHAISSSGGNRGCETVPPVEAACEFKIFTSYPSSATDGVIFTSSTAASARRTGLSLSMIKPGRPPSLAPIWLC